ncbi:MAG: F0F1 ATP synthase subunit epsilon [Nitrospirae bacterium]|nr:F0F1 ATP synthase subunit epsilon [Nitrospirota bacterium]MBF0541584.1 F0F1 ATP synthase subunit epsilon [Nitrospirota bacterium]
MDDKLTFEIVTPYGKVLEDKVDEIVAPGILGEFGVLPGHAPYISMLDIGVLTYKTGSTVKKVFINCGYADVSFERVTIISDSAELGEHIDIERAKTAHNLASEQLKQSDIDLVKAEAALRRALARIEAASKG